MRETEERLADTYGCFIPLRVALCTSGQAEICTSRLSAASNYRYWRGIVRGHSEHNRQGFSDAVALK